MQVLTLVVPDDEKVDPLLTRLYDEGIRGGTILESAGMTHTLVDHDDDDIHHFSILRKYLNPSRTRSKTIFFVAPEEQIAVIERVIGEVIGDMSKPETGFLFIQDVVRVKGSKALDAE